MAKHEGLAKRGSTGLANVVRRPDAVLLTELVVKGADGSSTKLTPVDRPTLPDILIATAADPAGLDWSDIGDDFRAAFESGNLHFPISRTPILDFHRPGHSAVGEYMGYRIIPIPGRDKEQRMYDLRITLPGTDRPSLLSLWGSTVLDKMIDADPPPTGAVIMFRFLGWYPPKPGMNPAKAWACPWFVRDTVTA